MTTNMFNYIDGNEDYTVNFHFLPDYPFSLCLFVSVIYIPTATFMIVKDEIKNNWAEKRILGLRQMSKKYEKEQYKNQYQCSICLYDFYSESLVTELPCGNNHIYHSLCIEMWDSNTNNCPLCRKDISDDQIAQASS